MESFIDGTIKWHLNILLNMQSDTHVMEELGTHILSREGHKYVFLKAYAGY